MPKAKAAKTKNKKKILIVEDDTLFGGIYTEKFTEEGFDVTLAINGQEGLARIDELRPDLVLLDVMLPKLSGFQVLEAIRNHPDPVLRKVPVFVVTNLSQETDLQKAAALGAKEYFVKSNTLFSSVLAKVRDELGV